MISSVSVRDQAFRASSLIVHSLYKLYKFLGSSLVEFSTWFVPSDLVFIPLHAEQLRPVAILPVKPPSVLSPNRGDDTNIPEPYVSEFEVLNVACYSDYGS